MGTKRRKCLLVESLLTSFTVLGMYQRILPLNASMIFPIAGATLVVARVSASV